MRRASAGADVVLIRCIRNGRRDPCLQAGTTASVAAFPRALPASQCRSVASSDGWPQRSRQWARKARTRALLARDEWLDRGLEWRDWLSQCRPQNAALSVNASLEHAHQRWRQANADFDTWFNAEWPLMQQRARSRAMQLKDRLVAGNGGPPPVDLPAALMIGVGVGGITQGLPVVGAVVAGCGAMRAFGRYVTGRVDAADVDALFRFAPERFKQRRVEIFQRLANELSAYRKFKTFADYKRHIDLHDLDHKPHKAMDPRFDYTPEQLYEDAMRSVTAHPRVRDALGADVNAVAEPDKVVYRVHEEVTEIYLGWQVAGSHGKAEIQVKSTASLLDFIYVFPEAKGRYGLKPDGFVIRPQGDWSQDCRELPKYMKQPFGKHNGRLYPHRDGVFDWDYDVREFRHGWEDGRAKYRA